MDEKGMKFDLSNLKPENIEELIQALEEMEVNIDSEEHTVRVYCA
jgi:dissimilatory sulfite reductase (desulfoviridin) alpha/beta subunit